MPAGRSGFRPLLLSSVALDTRPALIDAARNGLDLQTYLLGDDSTGHQILRALRDAAGRGVRLRLLIDDLADAYVMRSDEANFLDFDLLAVGAVAPALAAHFDAFWNSRFAVPLQALADNPLNAAQRRASFERLSSSPPGDPPGGAQRPPLPAPTRAAMQALGKVPLVVADAEVLFDSPDKTGGQLPGSTLLPVAALLDQARERVMIVAPYFLPNAAGLARMRAAQARGVVVQVVTNSLLDSDEPLVSLAYGQRRQALLAAGVRLFEISSERLHQAETMRRALGSSVGRMHAKQGFIDDRLLLVGSMNLDPRSATTNTELALAIDSSALVRMILGQFQPTDGRSAYEVRLAADGQRLDWVATDDQGVEHLGSEPTPPWWQVLKLWLLSRLIPDDLL